MDKTEIREKFLKEHPTHGQRDYTHKDYSMLNKEVIKKIIALYPNKKNIDIAEEIGLSENQLSMIIIYLRKAGVTLKKEKFETSLSYIITNLVEEINQENKSL